MLRLKPTDMKTPLRLFATNMLMCKSQVMKQSSRLSVKFDLTHFLWVWVELEFLNTVNLAVAWSRMQLHKHAGFTNYF